MSGAVAPAEAPDELLGITAEDCADGCRDGHCVITHRNHCGHPNKGGIQSVDHMNPDTLRRHHAAKRRLKIDAAKGAAEDAP